MCILSNPGKSNSRRGEPDQPPQILPSYYCFIHFHQILKKSICQDPPFIMVKLCLALLAGSNLPVFVEGVCQYDMVTVMVGQCLFTRSTFCTTLYHSLTVGAMFFVWEQPLKICMDDHFDPFLMLTNSK